jgi:hypothetical protein
MAPKESMKTNFFSPLSFIAVFGLGSGMGKNQDPRSGINIPDPHHWGLGCLSQIQGPGSDFFQSRFLDPGLTRSWIRIQI